MKWLSKVWAFIQELVGENAYEKYLAHQVKHHPDQAVLSKKEFFKLETERKWDGVRRCC